MSIPRLVIAGTHSGVGKTTVAVGLMAALSRRGLRVVPYKVGPDYIDPSYHRLACGRASTSLDIWMMGQSGVQKSLARVAGADIAIIEGMMGLHDGAAADSQAGSTAEVAGLLAAPVILVIDGSALARSAGALVLGYRSFDLSVNVTGAVANYIAGPGHAAYLKPAIEKEAATPFLGWLPRDADAAIPERHLGLVMPGKSDAVDLVQRLADLIESHLDIDYLLAIAQSAPDLPDMREAEPVRVESRARIAVAQDDAFCFYYPENLALLEAYGAEIVPFSPLGDDSLPEHIDGIYMGGGYPELHAGKLAANSRMLTDIRGFAALGKPVYAECGGFMYLCESIVDTSGESHLMAGLIPGSTVMHDRLQVIGYREVTLATDSLLGPVGSRLRGHEFRYSSYEGPTTLSAYEIGDRRIGFAEGNILASYVHVHLGSSADAAESFVSKCQIARGGSA